MGYTPHILVIGGGVVGTGIARDLAIRGLDVTLVERGTLASGTTGRLQGLLDSGARHAATDPAFAKHCLAETRTLREIAGHCVEGTGGFLVSHGDDDPDHLERSLSACRECDIPVEVLDGDTLQQEEPALSTAVERGLQVPDAVVDPSRLTVANARSAQNYGAEIRAHTEVTEVAVDGGTIDTVTVCHDPPPARAGEDDAGGTARTDGGDRETDTPAHGPPEGVPGSGRRGRANMPSELQNQARFPGQTDRGTERERTIEEIEPDYVVNAAGAWATQVAELAGLRVTLAYRAETVLAVDGEQTSRPITRCREREKANAVVPSCGLSLLGSTDRHLDDPDDAAATTDDVDLLVEELSAVVPRLAECRPVRADCAVRSLYRPATDADTPAQSGSAHGFTVLDHGDREGRWGMTTVLGGSLTTHRLVAERVVDDICGKFGITRPCRTDEIPLPEPDPPEADGSDTVVCECRDVTRGAVRAALADESSADLDLREVGVRTGASTGECQGGLCAHRLAAELAPAHGDDTVEDALDGLLADRWDGQRAVLWGDQLAQAMRTYAFHVGTLNRKSAPAEVVPEGAGTEPDERIEEVPAAASVQLSLFDDGPEQGADSRRPTWGEHPR